MTGSDGVDEWIRRRPPVAPLYAGHAIIIEPFEKCVRSRFAYESDLNILGLGFFVRNYNFHPPAYDSINTDSTGLLCKYSNTGLVGVNALKKKKTA